MTHSAFWRGKRVFVTGHTGFKGSWLSLWLQRLGAAVTGYALAPPTSPSLFEVADAGAGMDSVLADLRDESALSAAIGRADPEIVLHLAAQSLVREGYARPVETFDVNLLGTVRLLDALRQAPSCRAVVVVTTDKCYDNREWPWGYRETDTLGGRDPYAASKACAELAAAAYRASYFADGPALATARAGNVIGGGDWGKDRLVPDILAAVRDERPLTIRYPEAVRPWQHVLEPLSGYLTLAERLWADGAEVAEAWNFGPPRRDARPVRWVVERLFGAWGESVDWGSPAQTPPHEAGLLELDSSKAWRRLGWRPRWTLEESLASIAAWHRAHDDGAEMRRMTEEQIAAYEAAG